MLARAVRDRFREGSVSGRVRIVDIACMVPLLVGCAPVADAVVPGDESASADAAAGHLDASGSSEESSIGTDDGTSGSDDESSDAGGDTSTGESDDGECGDAAVLLCEDFDDPVAPLLGWASWVTATHAHVDTSDVVSVSPRTSLATRIDDADHLRAARVFRGVRVEDERVDVSFALRVSAECFEGGAPVELVEVAYEAVAEPWALGLAAWPGRLVAREGRTAIPTPITVGTAPLSADAWHDIDVDLDPIAQTIAVALDGKRFLVDIPVVALPPDGGLLTLTLGARREAGQRGGCDVHVDDVFVTRR